MGGGYLSNAGVFLVSVFFGLAIFIVLLRIMLQLVRANFFNPVCQFIAKVTNPLLMPMKRFIPTVGRLDLAAVLVVWLLQFIEMLLIEYLHPRGFSTLALLAVSPIALIDLGLLVLIFVIFIKIILSWVSPYNDNPMQPVLYQLSAPVLEPFRRIIPTIAGIDLSPMAALIALQLTRMLVTRPIMDVLYRL